MSYTESELKTKLTSKFTDNSITGDLADLTVDFTSRFLYLYQIIMVNTLMEDSFSRCTKLNSAITHAADNFYSVPRGTNRVVSVNNIKVSNAIDVEPYDVISSYGDFKLVYNDRYEKDVNEITSISCKLALDSKSVEVVGNGNLYIDLNITGVSDDIIIYDKDEGLESGKYTTSSKIYDLTNPTSDGGYVADIAVITQPDYSIRLWCKDGFNTSKTYVIKYLTCPDSSISDLSLDDISDIPNFIKQDNTNISETSATVYPISNINKIYLYTANFIKFRDILTSISDINTEIAEYFTSFQGFNVVVGEKTSITGDVGANNNVISNISSEDIYKIVPGAEISDTSGAIPSGTKISSVDYTNKEAVMNSSATAAVSGDTITSDNIIKVYYVIDYDSDETVSQDDVQEFNDKMTSYYIQDKFAFMLADYSRNTVTIDNTVFIGILGNTTQTAVFTYSGTSWQYSGSDISLSTYGLSINGTPVAGDTVTVVHTASDTGGTNVITSTIESVHFDFTVDIYYKETLRYDIAEQIIKDYQSQIGTDFSPYQMIADLMVNTTLRDNILYVKPNNMSVITLKNNERVKFDSLTVNYTAKT
mgnify:CR=1 FL=1